MLYITGAIFLFKLISKVIVEIIKAVSQIGALLAAYGWYTDQAIWMERGGATVAYAFLAGMAFLLVLVAVWGGSTLMLFIKRRRANTGQEKDRP